MEPEEEAEFLRVAYRFLTEITFGGSLPDIPIRRSSISHKPISSFPADAQEDDIQSKFPRLLNYREWISEVSTFETERNTFIMPSKSAICTFSLKKFVPISQRKLRDGKKNTFKDYTIQHHDDRVQSYSHLLPNFKSKMDDDDEEDNEYTPDFLDDPELRTGRHRTVITLTSFLGSISHFTKAEYLKKELNEKFKKLHPDLQPDLTLSKIRRVKSIMVQVGVSCNLELATIARSFCYFEKLIIKRLVTKENRKVIGGCCLILAAKATDRKSTDYSKLVYNIAEAFGLNKLQLFEMEWAVFAALKFNLQVPDGEFGGHLDRILTQLDYSNLQEYIGEKMHNNWIQSNS